MSNLSKTTTDKKLLKLPSKISSFQDVETALRVISDFYNTLVKSTNPDGESEITDKDGKTGDLRVTRNTDKTYKLEVKTEDGWKYGSMGGVPIKYIDKPAPKSIPIIEEIVNFPRPDYDSGWFVWDFTEMQLDGSNPSHTLTHNLGVIPIHSRLWFAPDSSNSSGWTNPDISTVGAQGTVASSSIIVAATPVPETYIGDSHDEGIAVQITSTAASIVCGYDDTIKGSNALYILRLFSE